MPELNANELKNHLRDWMRKPTPELAAHLRDEHGVEGTISTQKTAVVKLHADHHGSAPLTGADAVGATVKPEPAKRPAAKPATKTAPAKPAAAKAPATKAPARKAPATAKPATAKPATAKPAVKAPVRRTAPAKAAPKPATKAPANGAAANGSAPAATANATKHDLAKRLIDMVAREFAGETDENKAKLSYWLHGLPTGYPNGGGGGYLRYWPEGLPRPTTAGWRKPE